MSGQCRHASTYNSGFTSKAQSCHNTGIKAPPQNIRSPLASSMFAADGSCLGDNLLKRCRIILHTEGPGCGCRTLTRKSSGILSLSSPAWCAKRFSAFCGTWKGDFPRVSRTGMQLPYSCSPQRGEVTTSLTCATQNAIHSGQTCRCHTVSPPSAEK